MVQRCGLKGWPSLPAGFGPPAAEVSHVQPTPLDTRPHDPATTFVAVAPQQTAAAAETPTAQNEQPQPRRPDSNGLDDWLSGVDDFLAKQPQPSHRVQPGGSDDKTPPNTGGSPGSPLGGGQVPSGRLTQVTWPTSDHPVVQRVEFPLGVSKRAPGVEYKCIVATGPQQGWCV